MGRAKWTAEDTLLLKDNYFSMSSTELEGLLAHPYSTINKRAKALGLVKIVRWYTKENVHLIKRGLKGVVCTKWDDAMTYDVYLINDDIHNFILTQGVPVAILCYKNKESIFKYYTELALSGKLIVKVPQSIKVSIITKHLEDIRREIKNGERYEDIIRKYGLAISKSGLSHYIGRNTP